MAAFVLTSGPLESEAKGANAFTWQQTNTHSQRNRDFVSRAAKKLSNNNNGPEKLNSDGDGIPEYPKV